MIPKSANIVIVGGGMVGASLATAISSSPYLCKKKVCLLEAAPPPKPKNPTSSNKHEFSNRVSSINMASKKLLDHIGAWKDIKDTGRCHGYKVVML